MVYSESADVVSAGAHQTRSLAKVSCLCCWFIALLTVQTYRLFDS